MTDVNSDSHDGYHTDVVLAHASKNDSSAVDNSLRVSPAPQSQTEERLLQSMYNQDRRSRSLASPSGAFLHPKLATHRDLSPRAAEIRRRAEDELTPRYRDPSTLALPASREDAIVQQLSTRDWTTSQLAGPREKFYSGTSVPTLALMSPTERAITDGRQQQQGGRRVSTPRHNVSKSRYLDQVDPNRHTVTSPVIEDPYMTGVKRGAQNRSNGVHNQYSHIRSVIKDYRKNHINELEARYSAARAVSPMRMSMTEPMNVPTTPTPRAHSRIHRGPPTRRQLQMQQQPLSNDGLIPTPHRRDIVRHKLEGEAPLSRPSSPVAVSDYGEEDDIAPTTPRLSPQAGHMTAGTNDGLSSAPAAAAGGPPHQTPRNQYSLLAPPPNASRRASPAMGTTPRRTTSTLGAPRCASIIPGRYKFVPKPAKEEQEAAAAVEEVAAQSAAGKEKALKPDASKRAVSSEATDTASRTSTPTPMPAKHRARTKSKGGKRTASKKAGSRKTTPTPRAAAFKPSGAGAAGTSCSASPQGMSASNRGVDADGLSNGAAGQPNPYAYRRKLLFDVTAPLIM